MRAFKMLTREQKARKLSKYNPLVFFISHLALALTARDNFVLLCLNAEKHLKITKTNSDCFY